MNKSQENTPLKLDLSSLESRIKEIIGESADANDVSFGYKIDPSPITSSPYIDAASVLVFFDPKTIHPVTNEVNEEDIKNLIGVSNLVMDIDKIAIQQKKKIVSTVYNYTPGIIDDPLSKTDFNYDWQQIKKDGTASPGSNDAIKRSDLNKKINERISYSLQDEIRKKVLSRLIRENKVEMALQANDEVNNKDNTLQKMLTKCLRNEKVDLKLCSLDELNALKRVLEWLNEAADVLQLPDKSELDRKIAMVDLLASYKHMTGIYVNGKYKELFRGRQNELTKLREYVGVAPPRDNISSVTRFFSQKIDKVFNLERRPPLFIYGIGGVGKSTLLSKFILEHAEAHQEDRFPFVYLDFDRPALSAVEPETLIIDAARQLSIQYADLPGFSTTISDFYNKWRFEFQDYNSAQTMTEAVEIISDASLEILREKRKNIFTKFIKVISELAKKETKPFLLVLDTFEEVQYKGAEFIAELYKFLTDLQKGYPLIRAIISGRSPVSDSQFKITPLQLKDMDREAAHGFLERLGVTDPKVAGNIIDKVGGNPLSLKLAVNLNDIDSDKLRDSKFSAKKNLFFDEKLSANEIQGILYRRILDHIHNYNVRQLAHPGLVLRFITPELILHVLAKPCKLNIKSIEEAYNLFLDLKKEVSLVTEINPNLLRHRPDLRKIMLKLIIQDEPATANIIHESAIEYYKLKDDKINRAEELYHRLSLGHSTELLDSRWMEGVQNYLLGSSEELPGKSQAYLSAKTGTETFDPSIWDKADIKDKERKVIRKAAELLNSGYAEKALILINENIDKFKSEVLTLFKIKALTHLSRYEEAQEMAYEALDENANAIVQENSLTSIIKPVDIKSTIDVKADFRNYLGKKNSGSKGGSFSL